MGAEIQTLGGAVCTAVTFVAAGLTLGQVDDLNTAVEDCAKFTGKNFMKTNVRYVGQSLGELVAADATILAKAVTLGQVDAVNEACDACVSHAAKTLEKTGVTILQTAGDVADGIPVAGHIKGVIHYACGDSKGGDKAMKSASRTVGVVAGGAIGVVGGPAGMVAGGIAGGAVMDGVTTGVDSLVHDEYRPAGQIAAWTNAVNNKSSDHLIGGIIGIAATPAFDGIAGYKAGKSVEAWMDAKKLKLAAKSLENIKKNLSNRQAKKTLVKTDMYGKDGAKVSGVNRGIRGRVRGDEGGSFAELDSWDAVEDIHNNPTVVKNTPQTNRSVTQCAEAHARQLLANKNAAPGKQFTVMIAKGGRGRVRQPVVAASCAERCRPASTIKAYGQGPFDKVRYDKMPVNEAIDLKIGRANVRAVAAGIGLKCRQYEN